MDKIKLTAMVSLIFIISVSLISFSKEGNSAEREVVIGSAVDLSGPWSPSAARMATGRREYARYINEKFGGINGVKVKVITVDTAYNVDREIAAYKKFRDEDNALFMLNQHSGAAYAIERMMLESGKGMPHAHTADPSTIYLGREGWYFANFSSAGDPSIALLNWWIENRWKKNAKPKVALANSDVTPGQVGAVHLRDYLNGKNIPIVSDLILPPRPVDTTSFVLNMRKGNPDVVTGVQTDAGFIIMIKDMKRLGLDTPLLAACCMDENVLKVLGEAGVGVLASFPIPLWNDVENPGVRLVHDLYKEWYPGVDKKETFSFFWGWIGMTITVEGIKRAINKVGYEGLITDIDKGRKIVRDVMQTEMRGFDCMGMTGPLIYAPDDRRAFDTFRIYEVVPGGEYKFLGWSKATPWRPEQKTAKWWEDAMKGAIKK